MKLILFTGGARSGKSVAAERYAACVAAQVLYLATAEARDAEMEERITLHRARRPATWRTLEVPRHVGGALHDLPTGTVVLLDCLTLLVSNLLLAHPDNADLVVEREITEVIAAVCARSLTLIVVTNEVGMGLVPEYPLGRRYRDLLGRAAQQIAAHADEVYLVVAGIPVELRQLEAAWAKRDGEGGS